MLVIKNFYFSRYWCERSYQWVVRSEASIFEEESDLPQELEDGSYIIREGNKIKYLDWDGYILAVPSLTTLCVGCSNKLDNSLNLNYIFDETYCDRCYEHLFLALNLKKFSLTA